MSTFRITTNGVYRNYRSNLMKSNKKLFDRMTDVQTQRKFNTYAEDPAAASRAWRLRRSFWRTSDQIQNNSYVISKYETASAAMHAVVDGDSEHPGLDGILSSIEGVSDTAGAGRVALGRNLLDTAESIVSMMNTKYGDDYIFAGADGANIPFEWKGDKLFYRGIDVSTPKAKMMEDFFLDDETLRMEPVLSEEEFNAKRDPADPAYDPAFSFASYDDYKTDYAARNEVPFGQAEHNYNKVRAFEEYKAEYEKENPGYKYEDAVELNKMENEATYLDIGLGLKEDADGSFVTGSAFNSAVSGLKFLGYGKDENLAVALRELGRIFINANPETGAYAGGESDSKRAGELLDVIHNCVRDSQGAHIKLEADAKYLQTNIKQLETNRDQLNEQIMDTESMDPAEAITEMTWAQYCYNAALRIGTNILSQSLIDYMS